MTFEELPVRSYFYFEGKNQQIRKKISKRKYIWICDENGFFCPGIEYEHVQDRWQVLNKDAIVLQVSFKYPPQLLVIKSEQ